MRSLFWNEISIRKYACVVCVLVRTHHTMLFEPAQTGREAHAQVRPRLSKRRHQRRKERDRIGGWLVVERQEHIARTLHIVARCDEAVR